MLGARGTLTPSVDGDAAGTDTIVTKPSLSCAVGDGLSARDDASSVSPTDTAPFAFTGGTIDKVVVDVSGERHRGHRPGPVAGSSSTEHRSPAPVSRNPTREGPR